MKFNFFTDPAVWQKFIDIIVDYSPRVIIAVIMLIVGNWLIGLIVKLLEKALNFRKIDDSLQSFFISLVNIALKVMLVVLAADQIGIQTTSIVAMLGAASLAVGLALQGSLANFAGGVLILLFKPYKVGDRISAQGEKGLVRQIQIFNTVVETGDGRMIVMPNGAVSNGIITNHTTLPSRVDIEIIVEHGSNIPLVQKRIMAFCEQHEKISKMVQPTVAIFKIGEDGITLAVRPYCHADDYWAVYFETMNFIHQLACEKVIEIPEKHLKVALAANQIPLPANHRETVGFNH